MEEKKTISSGKWLKLFLVTVLAFAVLLGGFNVVTDPYGAFGDPVMQWWTYDMTLNPRMAKIAYLEQNGDKYDSFIIGASGSSILSVPALNKYLDASFYNTFFFRSQTEVFEQNANYLMDNYEVKNLVLCLSIHGGSFYSATNSDPSTYHYWKADGTNPLLFYSRYLFLNPQEGIQKLQYKAEDGYLTGGYRVMEPETGAYDKSRRDVESIGELKQYLRKKYAKDFVDYPMREEHLYTLDESMEGIRRIKARCEAEGVRLIVVCQPEYYLHLAYYSKSAQTRFYRALAQVTDYWDFTLSPISYEPRYFYDYAHARNSVGEMMLAKIFGDETVWTPEGFGRYVAQGSKPRAPTGEAAEEADYLTRVPILRYGEVVTGEAGDGQISLAALTEQLEALTQAGYTTVDVEQLRAYLRAGSPLPEKPVLLSFDGGFLSCYTMVYPLLQATGCKATFFAEGVNLGKDSYKDTGAAISPRFSLEQAAEMTASGLVTVASAGYDLHEIPGLDPEPVRVGALIRDGEREEDYVDFLTADALQMQELLGQSGGFFACSEDGFDERALVVLNQAGVCATVQGEGACAVMIRGLPQCLLNMPRRSVDGTLSGAELVEAIAADLAAASK